MTIEEKINSMQGPQSYEEKLYRILLNATFFKDPFRTERLGENMAVVQQYCCGWWKPRFLLNHTTREAYQFMDNDFRLLTVTEEDILWDSLSPQAIPQKALNRAHDLNAFFPTIIHNYRKGTAEVTWQISPDGSYYMDEDGFGMSDDEEVTLIGKIDRTGKVVEKFRYHY